MNIKLSESCLQSYPKQFEYYLEGPSPATCCSFNRHGTLLAIGCSDGKISILDFITRCFARILLGHASAPVCALSWSRNSRVLLSATTDNAIIKWCVESASPLSTYAMPCSIQGLCMHPRRQSFAIVSFVRYAAIILNVNEKDPRKKLPTSKNTIDDDEEDENVDVTPQASPNDTQPFSTAVPLDRGDHDEFVLTATYDWKGHYIIVGTNKGRINILHADNLKILSSCRAVSTGSPTLTAIRQIEVAKKHPYFLINTNDRVVRLFNTEALIERGRCDTNSPFVEAFCKLQDTVNRSTWRRCVFSGPDDEYVCGGSSRTHTLYIWELHTGAPVQQPLTLKGESLVDLQWHPHRAFLCSVSTNGLVACWTEAHVESYGAYAPSFQELEENLELDEREGEFDIADEDDSSHANNSGNNSRLSGDRLAGSSLSMQQQRLASIDLDNDDFYRSSDDDECEPNTESALIFITLTPDVLDPVEDVKAMQAEKLLREQQDSTTSKRPMSSNGPENVPFKVLLGEDEEVDLTGDGNAAEPTEICMQIGEPKNLFSAELKPVQPLVEKPKPPRFKVFLPENCGASGNSSQQQQFMFSNEPTHPIMAFIKKEKPLPLHHQHSGEGKPSGKHGRKGSTTSASSATSDAGSGGGKAEKGGGKHGLNLTILTASSTVTTVAIPSEQHSSTAAAAQQQSGKRWRSGKGK